jgi:hypothetical protein
LSVPQPVGDQDGEGDGEEAREHLHRYHFALPPFWLSVIEPIGGSSLLKEEHGAAKARKTLGEVGLVSSPCLGEPAGRGPGA